MIRRVSFFIFTYWIGFWAFAHADEHIIVSGGPALSYFENRKAHPHDRYWANFIDSALIRINHIRPQIPPNDQLTWLVYRPAYISRGKEMGVNLVANVKSQAETVGVRLLWFDHTPQLMNYLNYGNNRSINKIAHFDFFGHSNKACLMFDYSNAVDSGSIAFLHQNQLKQIQPIIFTKKATAQSYGCHSGESYSRMWQKHFGLPLIGAIGKTDYSAGGIPVPSSAGGRWTQ